MCIKIFNVSVLLTFIFSPLVLFSQNTTQVRDSINTYTYLDFKHMKKQLGITVENRTGPSGNPNDPNAANTDESAVREYILPDLLIAENGEKIYTSNEWERLRRPELIESIATEMYGHIPENVPEISWKVEATKDTVIGGVLIEEEWLIGIVDNAAHPELAVEIQVLLGLPKLEKRNAIPVVIQLGFLNSPFGKVNEPSSYFISPYEPRFKQQLAIQGWGYAILEVNSIQADHGAGIKSGIIGLVNKGESRSPDDWGVLRAWGWGASKLVDYFSVRPDVDQERVAVEGTSRYGKAALVAMAFDPRISLGFIGSSGAGGASILRRNFGESLENLASPAEYHWFSGKFIKYASIQTVDDLPFDAHTVIALCAPRPVFISAGSSAIEGNWVDAKGMFLGGLKASPVYELYGLNGYRTSEFPFMGTALTQGELAFRQHGGGHSTGPNWSTWIAWARRYWDN
ncbi:hypothetical protein DSM03_107115 [Leeuwenhoekiella aestuarii]|uniref:4-O-methyl-glucuronoyl methylesterase-like domain-containing protein n=1 Tax=Leeuwenhoekiella aestuarii TaxID=2249426 RepID=A0A4Q0NPJ0_9FLAO|nr:acetylxylan esterase [Leeuwenhoekiella aestuarii]RXG12018.1 hypothetical protein DSM04_108115 [Leeuwenhoekiella aestuarii]RXG13576.1 hypothetical protein DSM03_107115 [Leeuwenhoekiella aestuarii]